MQVFLPFPCVEKSLKVLNKQRLGKQRVEANQMIGIIEGHGKGWKSHPCTKMYSSYLDFLKFYYNRSLLEFEHKGGNNLRLSQIAHGEIQSPPWFGDDKFHLSHRSNLLRKAIDDANGIGRIGPKKPSDELLRNLREFGVTEDNTDPNLEYIWYV